MSARLLLLCPGQGGQHAGMYELARRHPQGAALIDANLTSAELFGATLANVKARNASFADVEMNAANMSGGDFSGASFRNASLDGARLMNATFARADFAGASLRRADIRGVDLSRVRNLTQDQVGEACADDATRLLPTDQAADLISRENP